MCVIVCDVQTSTLGIPTTTTATYYLHSPVQYRGYTAFAKSQHYVLSDSSVHTYIKTNGGALKADSHIAYRAHPVPLPCRADKGLECVSPI